MSFIKNATWIKAGRFRGEAALTFTKSFKLEKEIEILVKVGDGAYSSTAWGCDLTYDYVKINGDYRT